MGSFGFVSLFHLPALPWSQASGAKPQCPKLPRETSLFWLEEWRNRKKGTLCRGRVQGGSHMRELAGEGDSLSLGWNSHECRVTLRYTNGRHSTDFLRAELRFKPLRLESCLFLYWPMNCVLCPSFQKGLVAVHRDRHNWKRGRKRRNWGREKIKLGNK